MSEYTLITCAASMPSLALKLPSWGVHGLWLGFELGLRLRLGLSLGLMLG